MATLLGSETPRIFTPPLRELTEEASLGFEVIWFAEHVLGLRLFPWQKWLLVHALEWHPTEPRLRFRKVLVLVARQNGKTWLSVVLGLYFLFVLKVRLILGSAQNLDMAEETWEAAVDLVTELDDDEQPIRPDLAREVLKVARTNGMKALVLASKSSWKVKSITNAGRGKTTALLFLDELREHKTWEGWAALTKTTNAVPDALIWCMTNAGDGSSVVLRHLRQLAHLALGDPDGIFEDVPVLEAPVEDAEDDLAIFEWSASPTRGTWDRDGWCEANPSLGHGTISEHALASDARSDPPHVFSAEVLCQWLYASAQGVFPGTTWLDTLSSSSAIEGDDIAYALELSEDRRWASIHAAGYRADGLVHGEVIANSPGHSWVPGWFADRARRYRVAVEKDSQAWSLVDTLPGNVEVVEVAGADRGRACGHLFDLVVGEDAGDQGEAIPPRYRHREQGVLDVAAAVAKTKAAGAQWVFDRKNDDDISPLIGQAYACWLLEKSPKPVESVYESRGVMSI